MSNLWRTIILIVGAALTVTALMFVQRDANNVPDKQYTTVYVTPAPYNPAI